MAQSSLLRLFTKLALGSLFLLGLAPARASLVYLEFSGGNDSPLSITFNSPISFEVTVAPVDGGPVFIIDGLGDFFELSFPGASGLTYTVNGGAAYSIDKINSGYAGSSVTPDDVYFFDSVQAISSSVQLGDQILLSSGVLTSGVNVAGAAPVNGFYDFSITDGTGSRIGEGVAIPEPATTAAWLGGAALLGVALYRRRTR